MADRKQLNIPLDPDLAEAVHRAARRAYRSQGVLGPRRAAPRDR